MEEIHGAIQDIKSQARALARDIFIVAVAVVIVSFITITISIVIRIVAGTSPSLGFDQLMLLGLNSFRLQPVLRRPNRSRAFDVVRALNHNRRLMAWSVAFWFPLGTTKGVLEFQLTSPHFVCKSCPEKGVSKRAFLGWRLQVPCQPTGE